MITIFQDVALIVIGLAGGLAVGSGLVAFITVLDIIPRLSQIIKGREYLVAFQYSLVFGTVIFTLLDFRSIALQLPGIITILVGVYAGTFIGMLAAALTEVLNVLPILAKRLNMAEAILFLLMAMIFGKITGSLFNWLIFIDY